MSVARTEQGNIEVCYHQGMIVLGFGAMRLEQELLAENPDQIAKDEAIAAVVESMVGSTVEITPVPVG